MKKIIFIGIFLATIISGNAQEKHFINDSIYRYQVAQDFQKRQPLFEKRPDLLSVFKQPLSNKQKEALEFLYAYMPLSDLADYDGTFFLKQVNSSLRAQKTFSFAQDIPEEIFRHFVLPYRVNNEDLDTARNVFFNELKDRVKNLSIHDAVLEVNHWCHEKVSYKGTDIRTSSPLATVKNSFGRCGEESTFTVVAMRSVGIPARQVYTPRWAHTDDNHAWVEVYVDNKWQYLGACEPEPVLNKGWFEKPTKRAMLVHTNVFGNYKDTTNNLFKTALYSKINSLENYTKTKKLTVKVIDESKRIISDAKVRFGIYNYAEFYPMATLQSNSNGIAEITTGLGDLLISASKNDTYGETKAIGTNADTVIITLKKMSFDTFSDTLQIIPPVDLEVMEISSEKKEENDLKLAKEDSTRKAYQNTFMSEDKAKELALSLYLDSEKVTNFIKKSAGNWLEISNYLQKNASDNRVLDLLSVISDKDLRDVAEKTLTAQLKATKANQKYPKEIYNKYILNPRLQNEFLRPWKPFLQNKFTENFTQKAQKNIEIIFNWISQNIVIDSKQNYTKCPISPIGTYKLQCTDKQGRNLFFVALCRSLDIPARINSITYQPQYYKDKKWINVNFEGTEKTSVATAQLTLKNTSENTIKPKYYTHFTLQRFKNGKFETLNYYGDKSLKNLPTTLDLTSGYYCLMTGHRDDNGSVRVLRKFFRLHDNEKLTKTIQLLPLTKTNKILAKIDIRTTFKDEKQQTINIKNLSKEKGVIFAILDPSREPTRHIMVDIPLLKKEFDAQKIPFIFIIPKDKLTSDFSSKNYKELPKNSLFVVDRNNSLTNKLLKELKLQKNSFYPIVFYSNNNGEVSFISTGYKIGIGESLLKQVQ